MLALVEEVSSTSHTHTSLLLTGDNEVEDLVCSGMQWYKCGVDSIFQECEQQKLCVPQYILLANHNEMRKVSAGHV